MIKIKCLITKFNSESSKMKKIIKYIRGTPDKHNEGNFLKCLDNASFKELLTVLFSSLKVLLTSFNLK